MTSGGLADCYQPGQMLQGQKPHVPFKLKRYRWQGSRVGADGLLGTFTEIPWGQVSDLPWTHLGQMSTPPCLPFIQSLTFMDPRSLQCPGLGPKAVQWTAQPRCGISGRPQPAPASRDLELRAWVGPECARPLALPRPGWAGGQPQVPRAPGTQPLGSSRQHLRHGQADCHTDDLGRWSSETRREGWAGGGGLAQAAQQAQRFWQRLGRGSGQGGSTGL